MPNILTDLATKATKATKAPTAVVIVAHVSCYVLSNAIAIIIAAAIIYLYLRILKCPVPPFDMADEQSHLSVAISSSGILATFAHLELTVIYMSDPDAVVYPEVLLHVVVSIAAITGALAVLGWTFVLLARLFRSIEIRLGLRPHPSYPEYVIVEEEGREALERWIEAVTAPEESSTDYQVTPIQKPDQ